jgi:methionyl-tRNA formyltransferase
MTQPLRIAFMGSPGIALGVLEALIAAGHQIACVYSQPPRPAGRGQKLTPTPVHAFAEARGLEVRTPKSLKKAPEQDAFAALNLDAAVVVAYGLILPQPILDVPRLGCLNMHASILPRWRGAAPIQRAIMAGDTETGIDASVRTPITPEDTAGTLHDRLASLAAELAPRALAGLADGSLKPVPQIEDGMTYAAKITADDQRIDWSKPAADVDCSIRGLAPAPGAWCEADLGQGPVRLKILFSELTNLWNPAPPGTLLDDQLAVACGDGRAVRLLKLQKPGGKPLDARDFLAGTPLKADHQLGPNPSAD